MICQTKEEIPWPLNVVPENKIGFVVEFKLWPIMIGSVGKFNRVKIGLVGEINLW